jgi:hypothetical protein
MTILLRVLRFVPSADFRLTAFKANSRRFAQDDDFVEGVEVCTFSGFSANSVQSEQQALRSGSVTLLRSVGFCG